MAGLSESLEAGAIRVKKGYDEHKNRRFKAS
jgi:hypothetical protein